MRHENVGAVKEKTKASQQVLARAAAIRESASQFARDGGESSDGSSDGEEAEEGRDPGMIRNMLKMYYQDLGSDGTVAKSSVFIYCAVHMYMYVGGGDIADDLVRSAMMAAAGSCLVCLSGIKRVDAVRPVLCHNYVAQNG